MQRRNVDLPEPDGPEHAHHLAARDLEVDALEHLEAAEALVDALGLDHRGHAAALTTLPAVTEAQPARPRSSPAGRARSRGRSGAR